MFRNSILLGFLLILMSCSSLKEEVSESVEASPEPLLKRKKVEQTFEQGALIEEGLELYIDPDLETN